MISHENNERLAPMLNGAKRTARESRHAQYSAAHLLYASLDKSLGMYRMLEAWDVDPDYLIDWAEMWVEKHPVSDMPVDYPIADEKSKRVFEEAEKVRLRLGVDHIDPFCILVACITPGIAWSLPQLSSMSLSPEDAMRFLMERPAPTAENEAQTFYPTSSNGAPTSAQSIPYCSKVSDAYIAKGLYVIGRDREIRQMHEAFHRQQETGILIVADAGVGKTALLHGFCHYLSYHHQEAAEYENILILHVAKLISGCAHAGEVEGRLSKTLDKIRKLDQPIVLIDDIHILLEDKGGGNQVAYTLNAALSSGGLTIICTTTTESYTKRFEPQEALLRKLEVIRIAEPDQATVLKCLEVHRLLLEKHHDLSIADEALLESAKLSKRYFKDRRLPDSAINLLDRTLSATRQANASSAEECQGLIEELTQLKQEQQSGTDPKKLLSNLKWLNTQCKAKLSPVLIGQIQNPTDPASIKHPEDYISYLEQILDELNTLAQKPIEHVGLVEVSALVAHSTGIPIGKIQSKEQDKMLKLEDHLRKRVVGQDQAISSLSDAIIESRSGLGAQGKPIGSFFFLGPTGTGKTELAKTLAEFLFNDEQALIRFDMSEFKEEHSAALLYGAPPGYVGYEEGGLLVNKIRQNPYSIVLFDEIEKAHPSVYDIFLQIMDEGHIHDRLGKKGSFVDAIIIFTSNIGSDWIANQFREGVIPPSSKLTEIMAQHFRPEFLGRLTEIVPFGPITQSIVELIFDIQMKKFHRLLESMDLNLSISSEARSKLAMSGYSDRYGARPVVSVIRNHIRRPISRLLVEGKVQRGMSLQIDLDQDQNLHWTVKEEKEEALSL